MCHSIHISQTDDDSDDELFLWHISQTDDDGDDELFLWYGWPTKVN